MIFTSLSVMWGLIIQGGKFPRAGREAVELLRSLVTIASSRASFHTSLYQTICFHPFAICFMKNACIFMKYWLSLDGAVCLLIFYEGMYELSPSGIAMSSSP